ncbi:unnamed protein product [Sphagnum jensenii]|uniref:KxDL domain-containing protein n=1 Tax=Sphagnum jensenii TaxID=128206 RepID=A0ABP1AW80_9BRYO
MTKDDLDSVSVATATVAQQLHNLLSPTDVDTLQHQQLLILVCLPMLMKNVVRLGRLQDSNAVLSHFNEFSERSFVAVANNFSHNTRLLKSMKNDLDYVFHKISSLKTRIQKQYPNAFKDTVAALDSDDRLDLNVPQ